MPRHEGEKKKDFNAAVDSARDKALADANGGPGKYVIESVIIGTTPGAAPIRDYKIVLDGPRP
jgi:hypothetical protein